MFYCPQCGKMLPRGAMLLRDGALICPYCRHFFGYKDRRTQKTYQYNPQAQVPKKKNSMAIAALIFSILLPPYGLILGIMGLKQCELCHGRGRKLSAAAIAISIVWTLALVGAILALEFLL